MGGPEDEEVLYGVEAFAELWGVSERTARRWLQHPAAACFGLTPIGNTGGGFGWARAGQVNSVEALGRTLAGRTSEVRTRAARVRWGRGRDGPDEP